MTGDRWIRWLTAAVVLAVAGFAAVVSYSHIFDLGAQHGQHGTAGRLLPLSVDGVILAASLVLLHEARNARPSPPLARWMLGLGVAATVAANIAYGAAYGPLGAVISAWPAVAFIGSAEMAIGLVRRARTTDQARDTRLIKPAATQIARDAQEAAKLALAASIAVGSPLSQRAVMTRFGISRTAERKVRAEVLAGANGHTPTEGES